MRTAKHLAFGCLMAGAACAAESANDETRRPRNPLAPVTAVSVAGGPTVFDAFQCEVTDARFSDPLTASAIRWFVNEKAHPVTGASLTKGYAPDDKVRCEAQVTIGQRAEAPVTSAAVTVSPPSAFLLRNPEAHFLSVHMGTASAGRLVLCGGATVDGYTLAAARMERGFQLGPPLYIAADYSCKASFLENDTGYVFGWGMGFAAAATGAAMFTLDTASPALLSAKRFASGTSSATVHVVRQGRDGFILAGTTHPGASGWLAAVSRQGDFAWQYSYAPATAIDDAIQTPDGYLAIGTRNGLPWLAKVSDEGVPTSEVTLSAGGFESRGNARLAATPEGYLITYDELVITTDTAASPRAMRWRDGVGTFDILAFAGHLWMLDSNGATDFTGSSPVRMHIAGVGPSVLAAAPSKLAVYDDGAWLGGQIDEQFNGSIIPEHTFFYRLTPDVADILSAESPFSVSREPAIFTALTFTATPVTSTPTVTNLTWESFSPPAHIGPLWKAEALAPTSKK